MKLLELTLASPQANVALDEALLEASESADDGDTLRLWEPSHPFVVVGRSSQVETEVNVDFCRHNSIPIVRRCSGGAAIVTGKGCLMYGLILHLKRWPQLELLDAAHRIVLERMAAALQGLGIDAQHRGTSDLAVGERKISGNSMRRSRNWVLYHGTLLRQLSTEMISSCLNTAPRQPEYRHGRSHLDFVANVQVNDQELKTAIAHAWQASARIQEWPEERTDRLVVERYATDEWNFSGKRPIPR